MGLEYKTNRFVKIFGDPDHPILGNVVVVPPPPTPSFTPSSTPAVTPTPTPTATPPFNPGTLSGMIAWYDTNDSGTIALSGSKVTRISDKSGNNFHLEQSNASYQPTYSSDTIGTYIEFDGASTTRLSNTTISGYSSITATTKFMVFQKRSSYSNEEMLLEFADNYRLHYYWSNYGSSETFHGYDYPGPRWTGIFSDAKYPEYLNWVFMTKPTPYNFDGELNDTTYNSGPADNWGPVNLNRLSLGARANGGNPASFLCREVLLYDRELTTSEINQVESYLKTKWNYGAW